MNYSLKLGWNLTLFTYLFFQVVVDICIWSQGLLTVQTILMYTHLMWSVCGPSPVPLGTVYNCPSCKQITICYMDLTKVRNSSKTNNSVLFLWCRMFQLQQSSDCSNDYLEVREGHSTGTLVGRFCGDSLPSNYTSITGHILWIKFVSDSSVSGAGFRAVFSHCKSERWITLFFLMLTLMKKTS